MSEHSALSQAASHKSGLKAPHVNQIKWTVNDPYMPLDTVGVILRHNWSLLIDLVIDRWGFYHYRGWTNGTKRNAAKCLDGVMTNRSDRHREKECDDVSSSDFTSSDVISSSKSTVLSLPIWNKLPPPDSYRHHRQQQKYRYVEQFPGWCFNTTHRCWCPA